MERLTNKREADAQREEYERRLANGYPRNIPEERFLRLAAYEDTGLTPERCAEFARADAEGRYIVMRDAEQEGVARLRELAEADKEGRLVVLPCKVGDTVIDQTFAENPRLMKNTRLEIAYESRCGIIFHMGYDIFADLVEHGRIKPVSEEAERALGAMKNE